MMRSSVRGGLVGAAALGISVLAAFGANLLGVSVAAGFALLTILGVGVFARLMRGYLDRAGVAASIAVLGWAPLAFGGVLWSLGRPIVSSHWRCGTEDVQMFMLGLVVLGISCATTLGLSVVLSRTRIADGIIRAAAYVSVSLGTVITALALARPGVEPDGYVDVQPIVARTDGNGPRTADVHGVHVTLRGDPECSTTFTDSSGRLLARYPDPQSLLPPPCSGAIVRYDAAHGRFIVEDSGPGWVPARAYDSSTFEVVDVLPRDVNDSLRPPAGWVGSAVAGVGTALVALAIATWLDRRARRLRRGVLAQGTHTGDGWIEIMGSPTKHVPQARMLPIGPVIFETGPAHAPTYRDDAALDVRRVRRGTLAEWIDRTLDARASALAFAITAVALSCAPLVAARFVGLF